MYTTIQRSSNILSSYFIFAKHFLTYLGFAWISKLVVAFSPEANSVPLPIYMDEMLNAGRSVYDRQSTPTNQLGVPTSVNLSMYIEGIGSFRAQTMDFQLDVYLQQYWKDVRLAHNESTRILLRDRDFLKKIWHPDVYFANARIAQFHKVTQTNFVVWIEPDGSILYDTRVSMTVICAMQLQNYPLDSQWCELRILSYAYDVHQLEIAWIENNPITKNPNITMSDMHIVKLVPGLCDGNYSTGLWSCVTAEFFVSREITHHILQTYVPTTLIVIISWFSFWLDVEAVPARVSLAITTLLTLSTQANAVRNSLPEVSYMKSLDLFLAVSVLFVFGVLIEFTIVNYTQRNATIAARGDRAPGEDHSASWIGRVRSYISRSTRSIKNFIESCSILRVPFDQRIHHKQRPQYPSTQDLESPPSIENGRYHYTAAVCRMSAAAEDSGQKCLSGKNQAMLTRLDYDRDVKNAFSSSCSCYQCGINPEMVPKFRGSYSSKANNNASSKFMSNRGHNGPFMTEYRNNNSNRNSAPNFRWDLRPELGYDNVAHSQIPSLLTKANSAPCTCAYCVESTDQFTDENIPCRQCRKTEDGTKTAGDGNSEAVIASLRRKLTSESKWRLAVSQIQRNKRAAGRIQAKRIDAWSRWVFPLSYLTFHISYWTYYLFFAN